MKGMAHGRPLHRPAPVPPPGRGSGAARRGAARRGARVRARLRDHHEPRRPHRGVQPRRGAHVRLSAGRRRGQDRWPTIADPRAPARRPPRRARALPVDRREHDPRPAPGADRAAVPTARSSRSRSRSSASARTSRRCSPATCATSRRASAARRAPGGWPRSSSTRATRSSASAWTGGSSRGTRARSGCTAGRPTRRSACRSPTPRPRTARDEADYLVRQLMEGKADHQPPHRAPAQGRRARRRRAHAVADPRRGRRA